MRYLYLVIALLSLLPSQPAKSQGLPPHIDTALSYVGTVEFGHNRGPDISRWLHHVGLPAGNPYCAAFGSWCLDAAGAATPKVRSGLATRFITPISIPAAQVLRVQVRIPAGTIAIFRYGNGPHGHFAFVLTWHGANGVTVEANTTKGPYRSAKQGVWIRRRSIYPGNYFRIVAFTRVGYSVHNTR